MKTITFRSVVSEIIREESRKGRDMTISHGTAFLRRFIEKMASDPVAYQVFLLKEIDKRRKK